MKTDQLNDDNIVNNESFIRWQQITIEQMTYALNLFILLDTGVLGFSMNYLKENTIVLSVFSDKLFIFSLICILISILSGVLCVINRLLDFRWTKKIVRLKQSPSVDGELEKLRGRIKFVGSATWKFFWTLISFFALGISSMIISFCVKFV